MITIRQRLQRELLGGAIALIGIGTIGIFLVTRAALIITFDKALLARALSIASSIEYEQGELHMESSDQFMREFDESSVTHFFQIRNVRGQSLLRSASSKNTDLDRTTGTISNPEYWNMDLPSGVSGRAIGIAFTPREEETKNGERSKMREGWTPDKVELVVASERKELDQTLATLTIVLAGFGIVLVVTTVLLVPRLLLRKLSPLDQLANQAASISSDSISNRFRIDGLPDELKLLGSRLNDLMERLETSFVRLEESLERERRFSADVAHELRTPIAELRSYAELALRLPQERTIENDREVRAIALQMEALVSSLLNMLRSEQNEIVVKPEHFSIGLMIEHIVSNNAYRIEFKSIDYSMDILPEVVVCSDQALLRSILQNLIDNAIEYTPANGAIRIQGAIYNGLLSISVINTVESLSANDVSRLFDRFWRKDRARPDNEHFGLGLSISRAFVKVLGLNLNATLNSDSSLTILLSCIPTSPSVSAKESSLTL